MQIETLTLGEVKPLSQSHTTEKWEHPDSAPNLSDPKTQLRGGDLHSHALCFSSLTVPLHPCAWFSTLHSGSHFLQRASVCTAWVMGVSVRVLGDGGVSVPALSS